MSGALERQTRWLLRAWLALAALVALVVVQAPAQAADKPSIVIRDFEGTKSEQVRTWVVQILDKNADYDVIAKKRLAESSAKLDGSAEAYVAASQELGVAAILEGVVTAKGAKWKLELNIVNGADGESIEVLEFTGTFAAGLKKAVTKDLLTKVAPPLAKAKVAAKPEPKAAAVDAPAAKTEPEPEDEDEPEPKAKDEDTAGDDDGEKPAALVLGLRGGVLNRDFQYTDDLNGTLRPYELGAAPFARLDLEFYPGAISGSGPAAHIGIVGGYQQAFGLTSETSEGAELDTKSNAFDVGLRGRFPLGSHELGLSGRYGQHVFELDDGDTDFIPSVNYSFIRAALDARFDLGAAFVGLGVGYRFVLGSGEFAEAPWFPEQSVGAVDAHLEGGLSFGPVDVMLGVGLVRYFFTLNPDPDNIGSTPDGEVVAGGAVDQYLSGYLGVAFRL